MKLLFALSLVAMLSSITRAFTASAPVRRLPTATVGRFFSTANDDSDDKTSLIDTCRDKITRALQSVESVQVTGAYDDPNGSHIAVVVVSDDFANKRPVQRQQLIYKALWEELQGPVHAVDSMICKTPSEV